MRGTRDPVDQVLRRDRIAREHPEITFRYVEDFRYHQADVPDGNGTRTITEYALRALLDRVEDLI